MQRSRPARAKRVASALAALSLALVASGPLSATAQEAERDAAEGRLAELEGELGYIVDRYNDLNRELATIRREFRVTERRVRELARGMLKLEDRAVEMARSLYKGGSIAGLEGLLTAGSLNELATHLKYLESTGQAGLDVFGKLAADRRELEARLDELDESRAATLDAVTEMSQIRTEVESQIAQEREAIEQIDAELAAEAEVVVSSPAPVAVAPVPAPEPVGGRVPDWDAIAMCESGGNWHLDSTYDGGLQFHPDTWLAYGGGKYARYAWQATREQQIAIGEKVFEGQGPGAWPNCFQWQ